MTEIVRDTGVRSALISPDLVTTEERSPTVRNPVDSVKIETARSRGFKVLKIAPTPFFADYGCHVRILEETLALQRAGSKVVICTYRSGNDVPGIDIRRCIGLPWANGVKVGSSRRKILFDAWLAMRSMTVSLGIRPDIVHAHLHEGALIGLPLSKLYRAPLIFDFQGSLTSEMIDHDFLGRDSVFFNPLRQMETIINKTARAIITSSHNAADVLMKEFGCDSRKIFPILDCVNPERFRPRWEVSLERKEELLRDLGIPPGRKVVVFLGLLAEYQGISHLLRAIALLCARRDDVHLLLMGFPGHERYRAYAESLGIGDRVTIPGRIGYDLAPDHLALGDVAVSPKISETEGNGKLLNYMAVGLPTVTFNTPVSQEILAELGVYAKLGDVEDLARALENLIVDEARAAELGRALRVRVIEKFDWGQAIQRILDVYSWAASG